MVMSVVDEQLGCSTTSWSVGVPGAIAEFHRTASDGGRPVDARCVVTRNGGLRIEPREDVAAHAYEVLTVSAEAWHHGVVLSLPRGAALMSRRDTVTELGPDTHALRPEDREAVLFDLGLGSAFVDFCVRASDPEQIALLRSAVGTSFLRDCCHLYDRIVELSPQRVFVSALARIEIYQRIGRPGAATPHGPHTHLLPKLFRAERTHLAHLALPPERAPCLTLYPANPVLDAEGRVKRFDAHEHAAFEALLERFGDPIHVRAKQSVRRAVAAGLPPQAVSLPADRRARIACRIALRQLSHMSADPLLSAWRAGFERRYG